MFALFYGIELEFLSILHAEFQQSQFITSYRYLELNSIDLDIRLEWDNYLLCQFPEFGLDFGNEFTHYRLLFLLYVHLEAQVKRLYDRASSYSEEIAERFIGISNQGEYVHVAVGSCSNNGFGVMLLKRIYLLLINLSPFEIQSICTLLHKSFVVLNDFIGATLEQMSNFGDIGIIVFFGNLADAASSTFANMIFQTRTELVSQDCISRDIEIAGTDLIVLAEEIQEIPCVCYRTVRAEIGIAFDNPSGQIYLSKFIHCHTYPRICFRILK